MTDIVMICARTAVTLAMLLWIIAMLYPNGWFFRYHFKKRQLVLESDFRRFAEASVGFIVITTPTFYVVALSHFLSWDDRSNELLGAFGAFSMIVVSEGVILATLALIATAQTLVNGLDAPEQSWLGRRLLKTYNNKISKLAS